MINTIVQVACVFFLSIVVILLTLRICALQQTVHQLESEKRLRHLVDTMKTQVVPVDKYWPKVPTVNHSVANSPHNTEDEQSNECSQSA